MNQIELKQTIINFPDVKVHVSAGHKLRGYISSLIKNENSHLFHNHDKKGKEIYRYPRIQYKVVNKVPYIVGLMEGSDQLVKLFLNIRELNLGGESFPVHSKTISQNIALSSVNEGLNTYRFETLWMGLNQKNYHDYVKMEEKERPDLLNRCLANNILSFYKGVGFRVESRILVNAKLKEHHSSFKNQPMVVFSGTFTTNALLPDLAGIGKSVSRGYGTIRKIP